MTILIAGCGYLGTAAAGRLRRDGHRVIGLTRTGSSADALKAQEIEARAGDLADADFLRSLPPAEAVIHCAASGRGGGPAEYQRVYVEGVRRLLESQPGSRLLFTSSTSVYPQIDGSWVTEESPANPDRETGRILREAEDLVLSAGGTVLRLAGIYGPGRSVLLKNFLLDDARIDTRTEPPATPDGRWINQIHRDDAAAAISVVLKHAPTGIFNVVDRTPMTQRVVYAELADRFNRPLPPQAAPAQHRKRGWSHKRVDASKLLAAGWSLRFPSWFEALDRDPDLVPSILAQLDDAARM